MKGKGREAARNALTKGRFFIIFNKSVFF